MGERLEVYLQHYLLLKFFTKNIIVFKAAFTSYLRVYLQINILLVFVISVLGHLIGGRILLRVLHDKLNRVNPFLRLPLITALDVYVDLFKEEVEGLEVRFVHVNSFYFMDRHFVHRLATSRLFVLVDNALFNCEVVFLT